MSAIITQLRPSVSPGPQPGTEAGTQRLTRNRRLTNAIVKAAKPGQRDYKLHDGDGLYVFVTTKGAKIWRWRTGVGGKDHTEGLGSFPEIDVPEARKRRDRLKADQVRGEGRFAPKVSPAPLMPTLRTIATRWMDTAKPGWLDQRHERKSWHVMAEDILAFVPPNGRWPLGDTPIDEIKGPMLLAALRKIEPRSVDVAHRTLGRLVRIFKFACGEVDGYDDNPALRIAGGNNLLPFEGSGLRHAITDLDEARACLLDLVTGSGRPHTRLAILLLALTGLRPTELCGGEWSELNGDLWTVPGSRMKPPKLPHQVPLARQAIKAFDVLREITGRGRFMFTSLVSADAPLNIATIETLHREKYRGRHQPHGWRSTFSTNMKARFKANVERDAIELMLAHKLKDEVGRRYDRNEYMQERRVLAQAYADMLLGDSFPSAAELVR